MLHMKGSNRLVWEQFASETLNGKEGYAVITVDLRKHGESKSPQAAAAGATGKTPVPADGGSKLTKTDYQAMVQGDLEAVKGFIYEEHQQQSLNMRKLAIVGAEMSGPLALLYTLEDWQKPPHKDAPTVAASTPRGQDVQAVVLLSPEVSVGGLTAAQAVTFVKTNPSIGVLVCAGKEDEEYNKHAEGYFQKLGGSTINKERVYYFPLPSKLRGTDLIGKNLQTEIYIQAFLRKQVADLKIEWVDRKSRLEDR
jgi:hypothetical protein